MWAMHWDLSIIGFKFFLLANIVIKWENFWMWVDKYDWAHLSIDFRIVIGSCSKSSFDQEGSFEASSNNIKEILLAEGLGL